MIVPDLTAPSIEVFCLSGPIGGLLGLLLLATLGGCTTDDPLFTRLDPDRTGVEFANTIPRDDSLMNPVDFFYVYNGGGVAAGDFTGDGRSDLYFAGNAVSNRLYLNEGGFQFRDVTETAGVGAENVWSTGVTLVDINQDGRMDIYVSVGGPARAAGDRANRLYVNQGVGPDSIPTFEERAEAYGIADTGYTTHSVFFDADRDGDLDLYVLNTATVRRGGRPGRGTTQEKSRSNQDRLYENTGDGSFDDISEQAGITKEGYGLGIAISDLNKDGWPDIYVANDLYTNDLVYLNDGDGTFTNRNQEVLKHQSYSAMGVDIADYNNDARGDIMVLDMLPQDPQRRRLISNVGARPQGIWQYGRNTLQLNNGPAPEGPVTFSEIGQLAGVEATGWSWAPLLADYDNDGDRDLFVTNGYGELVTHLDFVQRRQQISFSGSAQDQHDALIEAMKDLPTVDLPNRFFENVEEEGTGGRPSLTFTERTEEWASPHPGISNGAAFADLDQDGDLDLVTNNIDEEATILENQVDERRESNALRVDLHGPSGNREGHGAKITLTTNGTTQYHDHSRYRGYQSTVEGTVHFGLGADTTADSLRVEWPDGTSQVRTEVEANQVLDIRYDSTATSRTPESPDSAETESPLFRDQTRSQGFVHRHEEVDMKDFGMNPLLPHRYSRNGPGVAVGDVDGNGLDDVFVGSDLRDASVIFRQTEPGTFQKQELSFGRGHDDMGALLFDADGDGNQDLYVVSGGNAGPPGNERKTYQDRLYVNQGQGTFERATDALPEITASGSVVTAADYDEDGDLDLFVGGRVQAREYPHPPRSYILRNDSAEGDVEFTDVTPDVAPELVNAGLVTDALWSDFDQDGEVDLIVVGEWMPITFFENEEGTFTDVTEERGLSNTSGWWNSLAAGDFDRDGDMDYVAGNLGLNTRYEASPDEPVRIYAKDFDRNNTVDPVLTQYLEGTEVPAHGHREMTDKIQSLLARFPSREAYANASFDDVFTEDELEGAYVADAVRFETSYLEQQDDGTFEIRALPMRAQTAPVFGMQTGDFNDDGFLDLLMVGNWYAPDRETGRADAFVGGFLRGDGTGHFTYVGSSESGFFVDGDAKGLGEVATGDRSSTMVITQNGDSLKAFRHSHASGHLVEVRPLDRYATLTFSDGSVRREELFYGSTYLSQSSRVFRVPSDVRSVVIHGRDGSTRTVDVRDDGSTSQTVGR